MAIKIGSNFTFQGEQPNFERDRFATKADMKAFPETSIDDGHLSYCVEDGNTYQFKSSNSVDAVTGKWRVFKADVDLSAYATKAALDGYQSKYNADYVATKDFDYSELPANAENIDLNGYTMSINQISTSFKNYYNGSIVILIENANFNCHEVRNVNISSEMFIAYSVSPATWYNCIISNAQMGQQGYFYYCEFIESTVDSVVCNYCIFSNCTIKGDNKTTVAFSILYNSSINGRFTIYNVIIGDAIYSKIGFTNDGLVEDRFEKNIANPSIPGNAPSCEAVNTKFTTINNSITDLHASLESTQTDFVDLRNKVNAMPKTEFVIQEKYDADKKANLLDANTIYYING